MKVEPENGPSDRTFHGASSWRFLNGLFFGVRGARPSQVDSLDGVRGLAVLFVLFSHAANRGLILFPDYKFAGDGSGQIGVYLFFILSSFLLTRGLLEIEPAKWRTVAPWANYFFRRFLRIFPLYLVVLLTVWILVQQFSHAGWNADFRSFNLRDVGRHLLLIKGQNHFWTIAVECKFYLALPFIVLFCKFVLRGNFWVIFCALLAGSLLITAATPATASSLSLVKYLPIFLIGTLLAYVCKYLHTRDLRLRVHSGFGIAFALGLLVFMPNLFARITGNSVDFSLPSVRFILGLYLGCIVFFTVVSSGVIQRFFSWKPLRLLGIISFSLYLWHPFILEKVARIPSVIRPGQLLLYYGLSLLLACLSFLLFEKPFARIRLSRAEGRKTFPGETHVSVQSRPISGA